MIFKSILWLAWLAAGLVTLLEGDISRISYACAWFLSLLFMFVWVIN